VRLALVFVAAATAAVLTHSALSRSIGGDAGAVVQAAEPEVAVAAQRAPRERIRMPRIFHASRQTIKAMSVSDAAREVDADGDGIVVFKDTETASISVLYRRKNGELTLVQTEA